MSESCAECNGCWREVARLAKEVADLKAKSDRKTAIIDSMANSLREAGAEIDALKRRIDELTPRRNAYPCGD